ncbi:FHA domain-containing protein-like [Dorcoceras hygrometricum]|uniref:FHA domain-containing protein-like n=1 Tax=Dorcoceras hygrometricum TaxID=472368 RepID=A0A2Z7AG00_9LAMI|nr:FHA domain-containing protein-like [Dorcoceras hygrometricum]
MAPKTSASAKPEGQCPNLKLVLDKGPLSGRTMDFEAGSIIRVGRIVRGNTVSIKDAGISSRHLLIQAELNSDLGYHRWTVTDLDSSNGTYLNGSQLDPSTPAVLTDGDVIKIGEATAIRVGFEVSGGGSECDSSNVRRNLRPRGRNGRVELGVIDENSELGDEGDDLKKGLGDYVGNLVDENERKMIGRRTRGPKARELGNGVEEVGVVENSSQARLRRPRASRMEKKSEKFEMEIDENEGKSETVIKVEGMGIRNGGLRTRSSMKDVKLLEESEIRGVGMQRASTRSTRNSRKVESLDENGVLVKVKEAREGMPEKIGSFVEVLSELKERDEPTEKWMDSGSLDGSGNASVPETKDHMAGSEESAVDLEKMTLGEWFEFLEIYMPKQIIQVTEEMITGMKQKAEKLHEFLLHQKDTEAIN